MQHHSSLPLGVSAGRMCGARALVQLARGRCRPPRSLSSLDDCPAMDMELYGARDTFGTQDPECGPCDPHRQALEPPIRVGVLTCMGTGWEGGPMVDMGSP